VLSRKLAQTVVNKTQGQEASVTDYKLQNRQSPAPLPYSLSILQIDASKRFNLSPKMVLDVCQSLYEKHQLITYPRSDSRYLPKEQFAQAAKVLSVIKSNAPSFESAVDNANPN